ATPVPKEPDGWVILPVYTTDEGYPTKQSEDLVAGGLLLTPDDLLHVALRQALGGVWHLRQVSLCLQYVDSKREPYWMSRKAARQFTSGILPPLLGSLRQWTRAEKVAT